MTCTVLDTYSPLDYQIEWKPERDGTPQEHSAGHFLRKLKNADAIFCRGYRAMGCNVAGLAKLLQAMPEDARLFYWVEELLPAKNWMDGLPAVNLLRLLQTDVGGANERRVRDFLVEASEINLKISLATFLGRSDEHEIYVALSRSGALNVRVRPSRANGDHLGQTASQCIR